MVSNQSTYLKLRFHGLIWPIMLLEPATLRYSFRDIQAHYYMLTVARVSFRTG